MNWLTTTMLLVGLAAVGHLIAYKMFHVPRQMEAALLFGTALLYPVLRNPMIGIYAFFTVCPFVPYLRRLYYLVYERPDIDPLIATGDIIIAFIFIGLFFEFKERRDFGRDARFYRRLVLGYFVYLALRVFVFNPTPVAEVLSRFVFYGPPVLLFLVGGVYASHMADLKRIWILTCFLAIGAALYGLRQLYMGYTTAESIWFSSIDFSSLAIMGVVRPFSFFQAPVVFADYLQLGIIGAIMLWMWGRWLPRPLLLAAVLLYGYAILMTSVRSSWIGMFATVIFLFAFINVRGGRRRIVVISLAVAAYMGFEAISGSMGLPGGMGGAVQAVSGKATNQQYMDLLVTSRAGALSNPFEEHSFLSRMATWRMIIVCLTDPEMALVGRGLGNFPADSLYFTYLAEFGIPGLVFIVLLLIAFIKRGLAIADRCRDPDVVVLAKGVTLMNIVLALMSVTGSHIHTFPGDAYFWFFNGVLCCVPVPPVPGHAEADKELAA